MHFPARIPNGSTHDSWYRGYISAFADLAWEWARTAGRGDFKRKCGLQWMRCPTI